MDETDNRRATYVISEATLRTSSMGFIQKELTSVRANIYLHGSTYAICGSLYGSLFPTFNTMRFMSTLTDKSSLAFLLHSDAVHELTEIYGEHAEVA